MAEMCESNSINLGKVTVDIDCSEALKGLKAVTREAKKATQALKEFEDIAKYFDEHEDIVQPFLSVFTTDDLERQLSARKHSNKE
jgi:hypothetical protein